VPYKRMDLVVEAFAQMPQRRLVVIGDGPEAPRIRAKTGSNITLLGQQPRNVLRDHLQQARGFVFAAEEDFGIAPVEALACGTPVIAYGKGGSLETIDGLDSPTPTGVFFGEQTVPAIQAAVERFESEEHRFSPDVCRASAIRFGAETFRRRLKAYVDGAVVRFRQRQCERSPWVEESI
jgi:glycosyltransferase involved in cell wall biosynthesis